MIKLWFDRIVKWIDEVVVKTFDIAFKKVLDVLASLLKAVETQFSTAKGIVWFVFGALVILDIALGGKAGVIAYLFSVFKDLLIVIKDGGWQLVIVLLLCMFLFSKK